MNRHGIISIHPRWVEKIISGQKTVELRKSFSCEATKISKFYIYSTKPECSLIGFFKVRHIINSKPSDITDQVMREACVSLDDFNRYYSGTKIASILNIESVYVFEKKVKADELREILNFRPPMSWRRLSKPETNFLSGLK